MFISMNLPLLNQLQSLFFNLTALDSPTSKDRHCTFQPLLRFPQIYSLLNESNLLIPIFFIPMEG